MKRTRMITCFLAGALVTLLLSNWAIPAVAAFIQKKIEVSTGVSIYVDDRLLSPTDANGNPVEPFIYNGTTYLPVRAVGEAFGKTVAWDGKSQSVYLGKHDSAEPACAVADLDYFTGEKLSVRTSIKDNNNTTRYNCVYVGNSWHDIDNIYKINGAYSKLTGTLFQSYDDRSSTRYTSTVRIYGDGKLLWNGEMTGGCEPIDFSIDLAGVLGLEIKLFDGNTTLASNSNDAYISDFNLYT